MIYLVNDALTQPADLTNLILLGTRLSLAEIGLKKPGRTKWSDGLK